MPAIRIGHVQLRFPLRTLSKRPPFGKKDIFGRQLSDKDLQPRELETPSSAVHEHRRKSPRIEREGLYPQHIATSFRRQKSAQAKGSNPSRLLIIRAIGFARIC